ADMDIISMAQQARPKLMGHSDDLRAQFTAWSSLVKIRPSKPVASFAFNDPASTMVLLSHLIPRPRNTFSRTPRRGACATPRNGALSTAWISAFVGFNSGKLGARPMRKGSRLPPGTRRGLPTWRQKSRAWLAPFERDRGGRHQ